jgi:hypothetical protein
MPTLVGGSGAPVERLDTIPSFVVGDGSARFPSTREQPDRVRNESNSTALKMIVLMTRIVRNLFTESDSTRPISLIW